MFMNTTPRDAIQLSDSGFMFDPATGHTFSLNATAMRVFDLLRQDLPVARVAAMIAEEFDVDERDAAKDVADFVLALRTHGMVD